MVGKVKIRLFQTSKLELWINSNGLVILYYTFDVFLWQTEKTFNAMWKMGIYVQGWNQLWTESRMDHRLLYPPETAS